MRTLPEYDANSSSRVQEPGRADTVDSQRREAYAGYPDEHRCVFIHVPKTAGTSIVRTLFGSPSRHIPYSVYESADAAKFRDYFKFAFVRNPWDRLVSGFFYMKNGGQHEGDRQWAEEHLSRFESFDDFVRDWVKPENLEKGIHFAPQAAFIADESNRVRMDFVGRFETLTADFYEIAGRLGKSVLLLESNRTPHRHYTEYYTTETIQRVARAYARDIELFDYTFERGRAVERHSAR